ncbi:MAG: hypothetical protein AB7S26_39025 [Sandaracinaceae bacterium]
MGRNVTVLAVLAVLVIGGCDWGDEPREEARETAPEGVELRGYEVADGRSEAVRAALGRLFETEEGQPSVGRVSATSDGLVLVLGPPGVQEGVGQLIERLGAAGDAASRSIITTDLWVVAGVPGETGELAPSLAPVASALEAVTSAEGPHRFVPVERVSLRTQENEHGQVAGEIELGQIASVVDGRVLGDVSVNGLGSHLHTTLSVRPGQIAVLGTSSVDVQRLGSFVDLAALNGVSRVAILYVLRCSVESPGGSE